MNVTITHPVSNFTGTVTVLETVSVGFTSGTATVDITEQAVEAFRDLYGASAVVAGTPGPAPAFDANLDASVNKIVGNSTSTTSGALRAAYATRAKALRGDLPTDALASQTVSTDVPVLTLSGPGGNSPITGQSSPSTLPLPYNTTRVTFLGASMTPISALSVNYMQNLCGGIGGSGAQPYAIEFDTYRSDFAIAFRNNVSGASAVWVWADGKPTTAAPVTLAAASANSLFYERVTFPTRKFRRVRVYLVNADFGGLDITTYDPVAPTPRPARRIAVYGDSYVAGTGATSPLTGLAMTAARSLGAELFLCGYGGTGYNTANAGTGAPDYLDTGRVGALLGTHPDIVVVLGSINDATSTPAQVTAKATSLYSQITATAAILIVVGVQTVGSTVSSANAANNAALKTAAQAAGATFVDPIGEQWVTGTGHDSGTPVTPPTLAANPPSGTGGTLAPGTYYYVLTMLTAAGETAASNEVPVTITAGQTPGLYWSAGTGATNYKLYRGTAPGAEDHLVVIKGGLFETDTGTGEATAAYPAYPPAIGISTTATGDGSADVLVGSDSTHPTQFGHDNYGRRLASAVAAALAA